MIPQRLTVSNFLSYRDNVPTLDFSTMHVACLCGPNGHGKSALLDAITWCLWGHARGQVQDDLISHGAEQMRVELDFNVRDTLHRVIRSHNRGRGPRRQGASDLQLQVLHQGPDGLAQPIPGNTIRETQERIIQLIGMDYDTFINSAFLLQGHADEFTSRTPAERKEVLSRVLNLGHYDLLQDRARTHATQARSEVDAADARMERLQQEVTELGDPHASLAQAAGALADLGQQTNQVAERTAARQAQAQALQAGANRLPDLNAHHQSIQLDLDQLSSTATELHRSIKAQKDLTSRAGQIEQQAQTFQQTYDLFQAMEKDRQAHDQLQQQHADLLRQKSEKRARLEAQRDQLKQHITNRLQPLADQEPQLLEDLRSHAAIQHILEKQEKELVQLQQNQQQNAADTGQAKADIDRLRNTGRELRSKLQLLQADDGAQPVCPLCLTPLEQDRCHELEASCQREMEESRNLHQHTTQQLETLGHQAQSMQQEQQTREKALDQDRRDHQARQSTLQHQLDNSREAAAELLTARTQLEEAQNSLDSDAYAPLETREIARIAQQLDLLAYNDQDRQKTYQQMEELRPATEALARLQAALEQLPRDEQALIQNQATQQSRQQELDQVQQQRHQAQQAVQQLPEAQLHLDQAQQELTLLQGQTQELLQQQVLLQHQADRLEQVNTEVKSTSKTQRQASHRLDISQELANSLGRQGVQAMLIESVVPRLEEEANILLGRMTDNRIHLRLDTQRERRSTAGSPIETLDITVHDELGPRNYEMYSGGEAFRINLALRIALSRVLAQRTGATLPTLFIDEGFGTQDASGRERVLDAISAIQDDFQKIIVITHLEDLKDAFPVRIEVHKDRNGSSFTIA